MYSDYAISNLQLQYCPSRSGPFSSVCSFINFFSNLDIVFLSSAVLKLTIVRRSIKMYQVTIGWNDMSDTYWGLAAIDAGDDNWHDTKTRAWTYCTPEMIRFVFNCRNCEVHYILPTRGHCGWGYKGYGMSHSQRQYVELYYTEIPDSGHPYVYVVRRN
jgi:hypothetical protein